MTAAMRVVLAGITGTEKRAVASKLADHLPRIRPEWTNRIKVIDLEECIQKSGGGDTRLFAGLPNSQLQRLRWLDGWKVAQDEFAHSGATCQILFLHLMYATRGLRSCAADLASIAAWQPNILLTLIDDIYSIKRRIELKHYSFSLAQLYDWRMTEQVVADKIAVLTDALVNTSENARKIARCESLALAVKTPLESAARLIGKLGFPRAYASYPITSTRSNPVLRQEINEFRKRMHLIMPTFDPLTIEELPILRFYIPGEGPVHYDPKRGPPGREDDEECKRWDARVGTGNLEPLVWEPDTATDATGTAVNFFPVSIERREFDELGLPEGGEGYTTIHDQLTFRDLRFVSQADMVVCYRPYMDGSVSGGVNTEIENANMLTRPVVAYVGKDKLKGKPLQGHITHTFTEEKKFWAYLEEEAKKNLTSPRASYF